MISNRITHLVHRKIYFNLTAGWTDVTQYVIAPSNISGTWGIHGNNPVADRMAGTGEMTFTLDNHTGKFTPGGPSAYAGWAKRIDCYLELKFENKTYKRFRGKIDDIGYDPNRFGPKVQIKVVDWIDLSVKHPVYTPALEVNIRGGEIVTSLLADAPIPPAASNIAAGTTIYPTAFDSVQKKTRTYGEISKVVFSEPSFAYVTKDKTNGETFVFEDPDTRWGWRPLTKVSKSDADAGFLLKAGSSDFILKAGSATDKIILNQTQDAAYPNLAQKTEPKEGEHLINQVVSTGYPTSVDTSAVVLFSIGATAIPIAPGEHYSLRGTYADPNGGLPINAFNQITPVANTDYKMYQNKDGTGTDLTSSLVVTTGYETSKFVHDLYNSGTIIGWVTLFNCRGYGIYHYNSIDSLQEDAASILANGEHVEYLDMKYQKDTAAGDLLGKTVIEINKTPETDLIKVTYCANLSDLLMMTFLESDIGWLVHIDSDLANIDGWYYIQDFSFTIQVGDIIMFSWTLSKKVYSMLTLLSLMSARFIYGAFYDFGYVPRVSNLSERTFTSWIDLDAPNSGSMAASIPSNIVALYSEASGGATEGLAFKAITGNAGSYNYLYFSRKYSTTDGIWRTAIDSISTGSYSFVVLEFTDTQAVAWIDGVRQTMSVIQAPVGTPKDETGMHLTLGSRISTLHQKDSRIYDRLLLQTEINTLNAAGENNGYNLVTDGLIFQAPTVRTTDLASRDNIHVAENDIVLDNIHNYVGTGIVRDPIVWSGVGSPDESFFGIAWSPSLKLFVAVGTGASCNIMSSPNGLIWTNRLSNGVAFYAVAWSEEKSLFVAVGNNAAYTSPDGITWTSRTILAIDWRGITWISSLGKFMAVSNIDGTGKAQYAASTDGITWSTGYVIAAALNIGLEDICYGNGLYVTVGYTAGANETILTSSNGTSWTFRGPATGIDFYGCTYSPTLHLFVVVGDGGAIYTSPDGITWTSRTSPDAAVNWRSVVWAEELGYFMAVGETTGAHRGAMTSIDGINWVTSQINQNDLWYSVAYSPLMKRFVAVQYGTVYRVTVFD